jgi:DNA-binding LacI/PurR family transcriptional regulator
LIRIGRTKIAVNRFPTLTTKRPPTLHDVARASGVSTATVSRFRRGARQFSPELRARIEQAITTLGYSDNLLARGMVTGRSGVVGVVVLDLHNPHFTSLVRGAQRVAQQQHLSLALVDTAESQAPERQLVQALSRRVDGLVVSARLAGGDVDWITQLGKPVVFFGQLETAGLHTVAVDGAQAAQLLARHLVQGAHRHVAYLGYAGSLWSRQREAALAAVLRKAGSKLSRFEVPSPNAAAGQAIAAQVLLGDSRPDAVVAYNDLIALGFMHEAQRLGLAVPQQLSVAGFDDIAASRHVRPALTTVAMHSEQQGEEAMRRLLQLLDGSPAPLRTLIAPSLVLRSSTRHR